MTAGATRPRKRLTALLVALTFLVSGCRDSAVLTESFATVAEAAAAGAVAQGRLPANLPPGSREIRIAHDPGSSRRWGLFNFPPAEGQALRARLRQEIPLDGLTCNPPRRIEWWPLLLRERLDGERLAATGLTGYSFEEAGVVLAVNWRQGRAYYWTPE